MSELVDEPGLGFGAIYWRESSSLSFFKMKKNLLKRLSFKKLEKQNRILKILYNNTILPKDKRTIYGQIRHELRSKSSLSIVRDRKSTRLNSSHGYISYAVFCLKKKNKKTQMHCDLT